LALTGWEVAGSLLLLLAVTAGVLAARRPEPLVGWLWFLGTLVPVLGLVQAGEQPWADRFVYLPHVGLFLLAAWAARDLLAPRPPPGVLAAGTGVVLAALAGCTWLQVSQWRDSVTLLEHTLAVTGPNAVAEETLGAALLKAGRAREALPHLREAVRLSPDRPRPHYNLGLALATLGERARAVRHYHEALRLDPGFALAHYNLGVALIGLHRPEDAIEQFEASLRLDPTIAPARFNLAVARAELGDRESAIRGLHGLLRLHPDFAPDPRYHLGVLLLETRRFDEAAEQLQAALLRAPGHAGAHHQLGRAHAARGRWLEAEQCFRAAIRLQPQVVRGYTSLAWVLRKQSRNEEAEHQYQVAFRLDSRWPQSACATAWALATDPDPRRRDGARALELAEPACDALRNQDPRLLDALAAAYAEVGRYDQAVATARLALAAAPPELAVEVAARLKQYEARRPFRVNSKAR
jgi:tetratricopeptide (TPR) repeat protein